MNITLYSIKCPKCTVLEKKLQAKNIDFQINTSVDDMKKLGFKSAPILAVDDKYFTFEEAIKWIKDR